MNSCSRFSNFIILLKHCGKGTFHFSTRFIASSKNDNLAKQIEEYVPVNTKWVNCCSSEQRTANSVTVRPQCKWHSHQIRDRGNISGVDGSRDITPFIHSSPLVVTDTIGDNIGNDVEPSAKRRGLASAAACDVSPCAATRIALPACRNPLLMLADVALRDEYPLSYEVSNVLAWCIMHNSICMRRKPVTQCCSCELTLCQVEQTLQHKLFPSALHSRTHSCATASAANVYSPHRKTGFMFL